MDLDLLLEVLLDEGSAERIPDGYFGTIDSRPVCVFFNNGVFNGWKTDAIDLSMKIGVPLIAVFDCDGFDVSVKALRDIADFTGKMSLASGVIPRVSLFLNKAHWLICHHSDFVVMCDKTEFSLVLPEVIESFSGKSFEITSGDHAKHGNAHLVAESEESALNKIRRLIGFLPLNNMEDPPLADTNDDPSRTIDIEIPTDSYEPFNMKDLITQVLDDEDFFEIQSEFAQNSIVGFGRLDGSTVGIVANNPMYSLGCLDVKSMMKITNFVRFCDAFNIPIVNFIDTPGYIPDSDQELNGLYKYVTRMINVYTHATTPIVSVVVRKAYGSGFVAMGCKFTGADLVYAYPNVEFAVTDIDTDVKKLGVDKEKYRESCRTESVDLFVDAVIEPKWTRSRLINALRLLETKRKRLPPKKHDTTL